MITNERLLIVMTMLLASLAATTAPSTNSTDAPGGCCTYKPAAITFNWPAGWLTTQIQDFQWSIVPTDDKSAATRWIAMDVPTLPIHVPGFIPIGSVEGGYLDDLRKQFGKLQIKELTPPKLPNAKERLVRAAWQKDGKSVEQTALLIVHDDHVYIFRGRSDIDHEQATSDAFNSVLSSIQWTK